MTQDGKTLKQFRILADSTEVARDRAQRASDLAKGLGLTELAETTAGLAQSYQELLDDVNRIIGDGILGPNEPPAPSPAGGSPE